MMDKERTERKLRGALFEFFLWSLPAGTSGITLIELTTRAQRRVEEVLAEYEGSKSTAISKEE